MVLVLGRTYSEKDLTRQDLTPEGRTFAHTSSGEKTVEKYVSGEEIYLFERSSDGLRLVSSFTSEDQRFRAVPGFRRGRFNGW